ncbi:MAG: PIN domain-containing protein [Candidatus Promineifilaceae bacterium]|nr:PIN domain-containing protein [Candidatus Promineifilaceae bacterium]
MARIPDLFLDTSVVFAGIWSPSGGARKLLKLGEVHALNLWVSSQVLVEIENVLRRKAPQALGTLALLLDRSRASVLAEVSVKMIAECQSLIGYRPDAVIVAAAWEARVDYFVTLDRKHFLDNQRLHQAAPFAIGTPGSCLKWYRTLRAIH